VPEDLNLKFEPAWRIPGKLALQELLSLSSAAVKQQS
jgi:hypothetical protein